MTNMIFLIYSAISFITEVFLVYYLQRQINDPDIFKINKFHITKLLGG